MVQLSVALGSNASKDDIARLELLFLLAEAATVPLTYEELRLYAKAEPNMNQGTLDIWLQELVAAGVIQETGRGYKILPGNWLNVSIGKP